MAGAADAAANGNRDIADWQAKNNGNPGAAAVAGVALQQGALRQHFAVLDIAVKVKSIDASADQSVSPRRRPDVQAARVDTVASRRHTT